MGKKAKLKQLRRIANQLPAVMLTTCEKHIVEGKELTDEERKEFAERTEKKVNPVGQYVQSMPVKMAVNHSRRMKKAYQRFGMAGAQGYVAAVERHIKKKEQ